MAGDFSLAWSRRLGGEAERDAPDEAHARSAVRLKDHRLSGPPRNQAVYQDNNEALMPLYPLSPGKLLAQAAQKYVSPGDRFRCRLAPGLKAPMDALGVLIGTEKETERADGASARLR